MRSPEQADQAQHGSLYCQLDWIKEGLGHSQPTSLGVSMMKLP